MKKIVNHKKESYREDMHQKQMDHVQRWTKNTQEVKWDVSIISNGNLARSQSVEETKMYESLKDSSHFGKSEERA